MPKAETLSKLDYLNFDTKVLCFMTQSLYVWSFISRKTRDDETDATVLWPQNHALWSDREVPGP